MTLRAALLVGLAMGAGTAGPASAQRPDIAREIRQNRERIDSIRRERRDLEAALEHLRGRAYSLSTELQNIERQKGVTARIVNELDRQLHTMNAQVDTLSLDAVLAQDALAEKRAVLQKRLVAIYKRGRLWMFEVLLAAESFGDLISRYKYLYLVSRQDRALVSEVEELRDRVTEQRRQLVAIRTSLTERREERGEELSRYQSLERQRQRLLRETRASERVATTRLDSLARDEERLAELITSLEEARRRALARGGGVPEAGTMSEADRGALDWPADGPVIYEFGRAPGPDDTRTRRDGIGIGLPVGTPVRAIASGAVRHAGPLGTYGAVVLLDHGAGFNTLYLFLSRLDVSDGAWVERGDVIGSSGGASSDAGPHVELQIRQGGIALDPMIWLKPRR